MSQPFAIGGGAILQVFIEGQKFGDELDVMSWTLTHNVEAVSDGVCGEDADRPDHIHKTWTLQLTMQFVTYEKLKAYINYRADVDSQSTPEQAVGIKLQPRAKGKTVLYSLTECSLGGMGLNASGRTNRTQMTMPVVARYMTPISN